MASSKGKKSTIISAIISFFSFGYKLALGIYTSSLVLIIASFSTLMVFICKVVFVKNITASRASKKKAYLVMALAALIYSLIFMLFVVLKVSGIDISNKKEYEGLFGLIFIGFIFIMFILSIINLKGALEKTDIMVIGLKEMTFISALADLVIIQAFVSRIILTYYDIPLLTKIDAFFPLGIGVLMLVISTIMITRSARYKA